MISKSPSHFPSDDEPPMGDDHGNVKTCLPTSLLAPISPPRTIRRKPSQKSKASHLQELSNSGSGAFSVSAERLRRRETGNPPPTAALSKQAAIECGQLKIQNHLSHFLAYLSSHVVPPSLLPASFPLLPLSSFASLHERNQHPHGHLFVIHQHDHPIAGTHYDLRLQFSHTSSLSWAVPYGVPGNVASKRPNRMAVETRVHTMWSHMVETASHATGSMLIWDVGEYEVLPSKSRDAPSSDPGSAVEEEEENGGELADDVDGGGSESEKLVEAFRRRKIRIRLRGARLPKDYTLNMWVSPDSKHSHEPKKPGRKRQRLDPALVKVIEPEEPSSEEDYSDASGPLADSEGESDASLLRPERREAEDDVVRQNNAYTGASNTVGSIYQRKWFLTLDRHNSGFYKARSNPVVWERKEGEGGGLEGFEPFFVRGVEMERSVVTGRKAEDVMRDEGVKGYVRRNGWRPILE